MGSSSFAAEPTAAPSERTVHVVEEDLPSESVLPTLDSPLAVRSKLMDFNRRWELGLEANIGLSEATYTRFYFSGSILYHLSEKHGFGFRYRSLPNTLSDYSKQFQASTSQLEFSRAPVPQNQMSIFYDQIFLYGKMSVAKDTVLPAVFEWMTDVGVTKFSSGTYPLLGLGAKSTIYFSRAFGFSLGLRTHIAQAPNPLAASLRAATAVPEVSEFTPVWGLSYHFDIGFSYLF